MSISASHMAGSFSWWSSLSMWLWQYTLAQWWWIGWETIMRYYR